MCDLVYSMGKVIASLNEFYQKEKFHQSRIAPDDLEIKNPFYLETVAMNDVPEDLIFNWE